MIRCITASYAALGLLPSIPLPNARPLTAPRYAAPSAGAAAASEDAPAPTVGFGQIIRDAEGNVIDIILPEEDEQEGEAQGEATDEENAPLAPVKAKTDVVRSTSRPSHLSLTILKRTPTVPQPSRTSRPSTAPSSATPRPRSACGSPSSRARTGTTRPRWRATAR